MVDDMPAIVPHRCTGGTEHSSSLPPTRPRDPPRRDLRPRAHGTRIWKTSPVRNIIWDMGGTLVDTYPEVDATLAEAVWPGEVTPTRLTEVRGLRVKSIAHAIGVLAERYDVAPESLNAAYADLKNRWRTHPAPLMAGARELMAAITAAGGLNLVATHRDRTSAEALLRALDVHVDDLVCAPDGISRKPDPAMNLLLLERHRLAPSDVLAVGDRVIDVQAAEFAGIAGALLVPAGSPLPDLAGTNPVVASSLRELLARVN